MPDRRQQALLQVLEWSRAMGTDWAVGGDSIDWLLDRREPRAAPPRTHEPQPIGQSTHRRAESGPAATGQQRGNQSSAAPFATRLQSPIPPEVRAEVGAAREAAARASSLAELRTALEGFTGCGLKAAAKSTCLFRGAETAPLMIIGEAPGREEDLAGRPFVGRAGQLLDRMLAAIGLDERDVHITNVVYWRPPNNRTPAPEEAEACRPFLERQIELVGPRVLLLLGGVAAKHMLRNDEGILRQRGRWQRARLPRSEIMAMASLHPAYLLRMPATKRMAWRDLLAVRSALEDGNARTPGRG